MNPPTIVRSPFLLALLAAVAAAPDARAAASLDTCTGFVDSVPATIATGGVWCLRADLTTAQSSGAAITIAASNVVLDCNAHVLASSAAAATSTTIGIRSAGRSGVRVRDCRVRHFHTGVSLDGPGATLLDSRIDDSRSAAVVLRASPGRVQGVRITATGNASAPSPLFRGIYALGDVDIVDNTVHETRGTHATKKVIGILSQDGVSNLIAGNRVIGVDNAGAGGTLGVQVGVGLAASRTVVRDNTLNRGDSAAAGTGISCTSTTNATAGNAVRGWTTAVGGKCASFGDAVE
jgi:hypothetical protein